MEQLQDLDILVNLYNLPNDDDPTKAMKEKGVGIQRGLGPDKIFSVLTGEVVSKAGLKSALLAAYPTKRTIIEQVFSRY